MRWNTCSGLLRSAGGLAVASMADFLGGLRRFEPEVLTYFGLAIAMNIQSRLLHMSAVIGGVSSW